MEGKQWCVCVCVLVFGGGVGEGGEEAPHGETLGGGGNRREWRQYR